MCLHAAIDERMVLLVDGMTVIVLHGLCATQVSLTMRLYIYIYTATECVREDKRERENSALAGLTQ